MSFTIGQLVKVKPGKLRPEDTLTNKEYVERRGNIPYLVRSEGLLDAEVTFVVVSYRPSTARFGGMVGIRPEGSVGVRAVECFEDRLESREEWASHQVPAPQAKQDDINKAVGAGYIAARQRAWDSYAESRRKAGLGQLNDKGFARQQFDNVYALGYENAEQKYKAMNFATAYGASKVKPLSRAGEKEPAISKEKAGKLADLVLMSLQSEGPGTAHEIADRIGEPLNAVSPRFAVLKRRGLIHVSSGQRVGRGTRSVYSIGGGPL